MRRPLVLFAVVAWAVSFALPTIDMAGRGVAPGFIAAIYGLFTAPTVGRFIEAGRIGGTDLPFALLMAADATMYTTVEESVRPYRAPRHQHTPEMEQALELAEAGELSAIPSCRGTRASGLQLP